MRNLCRLWDGVMDDKIIILATNQLMNDENRELILPIRKKIWLEYGPIEQNGKNNIQIMKDAGVPRDKIAELAWQTRKFAIDNVF